MALSLTDEQIQRTGFSDKELLIELACAIYKHNKNFTLGLAAEMASIGQDEMLHELGKREIEFHYYYEDFLDDLKTVKEMQNGSSK